jgi:hypothetical protein
LLPMKSWKLMGPLVVSASKLGAMLPKRSLQRHEISIPLDCQRR